MKLSLSALALVLVQCSTIDAAFVPHLSSRQSPLVVKGYLDDLSGELNEKSAEVIPEQDSEAYNKMDKKDVSRYGPGNFEDFVDFDEFDGGDGQMGVAGDGNKGLEKIGASPTLSTSKMMSAKNAWGTSTGYAAELKKDGVEEVRAQQIENWRNQREVYAKSQAQKNMADSYDTVSDADEDWRKLAKFGVERNTEVNLDEEFGAVVAGEDIEGIIDIHAAMGQLRYHEMAIKNDYMGFADFRAAFNGASTDWVVSPTEGSLTSKSPTDFIVKFKPTAPGVQEAYLVIETEDMKKTWKLIGSTA